LKGPEIEGISKEKKNEETKTENREFDGGNFCF